MYKLECRRRRVWKPWSWVLILSSYGMAEGRTWTRRGAERAMLQMQGRWFGDA